MGLIHFRKGTLAEGRVLYNAAIQAALRLRDAERGAVATVYLANEEFVAKTDRWGAVANDARDRVSKLPQTTWAIYEVKFDALEKNAVRK